MIATIAAVHLRCPCPTLQISRSHERVDHAWRSRRESRLTIRLLAVAAALALANVTHALSTDPDLVATTILSPSVLNQGESAPVTITVRNDGLSATTRAFNVSVALTRDGGVCTHIQYCDESDDDWFVGSTTVSSSIAPGGHRHRPGRPPSRPGANHVEPLRRRRRPRPPRVRQRLRIERDQQHDLRWTRRDPRCVSRWRTGNDRRWKLVHPGLLRPGARRPARALSHGDFLLRWGLLQRVRDV